MIYSRSILPSRQATLLLLLRARDRNHLPMEDALLTYLRTAMFQEERRSRNYRAGLRQALDILAAARIPFILLKGAALAETEYESPERRHCHDVDFLVDAVDLFRAGDAFKTRGWRPVRHDLRPRHLMLDQGNGLIVDLHAHPYRTLHYRASWPELFARASEEQIVGAPARVPAPEDALTHVCVHAASSRNRKTLCWVCDSWLLIQNHPELDWEALVQSAGKNSTALPLSITLGYLAGKLDSAVPSACLDRLREAASRTRLVRFSWSLFPSPQAIRWVYGIRSPVLIPFGYLVYLATALARRLARATKRIYE